ncbi:MAG: TetR/AcrR family transcriptional regulator [Acidimicrobiales bacterium]
MADPYSATRSYRGVSAADRTAARRAALVDAAIRLFGTQGYVATGVKDICREAGVTDRYFYESFRDRGALYTAAFEQIVTELLNVVGSAALAEAGAPDRQARAAVGSFIDHLTTEPAKAKVLFLEAGAVGGEVGREVRASARRFAELLAGAARPHLAPGTTDLRLTMAALSLVGAIGVVILEWLDGALEATVEDITDYFVDMLHAAGQAGSP